MSTAVFRSARRAAAIVLFSGALMSGCAAKLARLAAAGQYDEVIRRVEARRRPPRGEGARAYAQALEHRRELTKARDVLLYDFRHGGHTKSLLALADLEARHGLTGMAANHYARVATLDPALLKGRPQACELWFERADLFMARGEAIAAYEDLRNATAVCPSAQHDVGRVREREFVDRVARAAKAELAARARLCPAPAPRAGPAARADIDGSERSCPPERASDRAAQLGEDLARARKGGPQSLWTTAHACACELPPSDVAALMLAEARGELGMGMIADDDYRAFVGQRRWADFAAVVGPLRPAEQAAVLVRLHRFVPDVPHELRADLRTSAAERLRQQALELPAGEPWRLDATQGDLVVVEFAISSRWRVAAAASADAIGAGYGNLWELRVQPGEQNVSALLVSARLREVRGNRENGLAVRYGVLRRALQSELAGALERTAREASRALALGHPWEALAVASLTEGRLVAIERAAASAIVAADLFCGGPCAEDDDLLAAQNVVGEAWIESQRERVGVLAQQRPAEAKLPAACPVLAAWIAKDAAGPQAKAFKLALTNLQHPSLPVTLRTAIESDLGLACAGAYALPIMAQMGHVVTARDMSDQLSHVPEMAAASQLDFHARLAMIAGDRDGRIGLLAEAAAAASREPAETWAGLARFARSLDDRDTELAALRQVLLHTRGLDHPAIRRTLAVEALHDVVRSWGVRGTTAGREALARNVDDYVNSFPSPQRWAKREELARVVWRQRWATPDVRAILGHALFSAAEARRRHPSAALFERRTGEPTGETSPFDLAALEDRALAGNLHALPPATVALVDHDDLEPLRAALASRSRDWGQRFRLALGLAVHGSAGARIQGAAQLLAMAGDRERERLKRWLAGYPVALEPSPERDPAKARTVVLVEDTDALARLVFGLDIAPSLLARLP